MSKIKILNVSPGDLIPEQTSEDYFRNELYDTPYLVTNDHTIIYTDCLAPCVAIAVFARDESGINHRIICHCPYAPPADYIQLEGRIEKYLKSINKIVDLKAAIVSMETFFEDELSEFDIERDSLIIERINKLFSFYKKQNSDFDIDVIQSSAIGIDPFGEFLLPSPEQIYEEYLEIKKDFPDSNMIYNTKQNTVSTLTKKFEVFNNCDNKNPKHK